MTTEMASVDIAGLENEGQCMNKLLIQLCSFTIHTHEKFHNEILSHLRKRQKYLRGYFLPHPV